MHLILDPPAAGDWNMAVDEALLEACAAGGAIYLRIYSWRPATLSLGYFQRHGDRIEHPASLQCPLVRRPSGGGALVHDREWTYALVAPSSHPLAKDAASLYRATHGALVATLAELGVAARLFCRSNESDRADAAPTPEPFLCFARRTDGDVLVNRHKIAGSAQRRRAGAVLQHGGVLLAQSPAAPELPGILETAGVSVSADDLTVPFVRRAAALFQSEYSTRALPSDVVHRAETLRREKYSRSAWTERR